MQPASCPDWEYSNHPRCDDTLSKTSKKILIELRGGHIETLQASADTRPIHGELFIDLAPEGFKYFAGHYRGENLRCLKYCNVKIATDPRVGCPSDTVLEAMDQLALTIKEILKTLDEGQKKPNSQIPPEQKLLFIVVFACRMFELLLRVHPYKNGNGHAARFMVWSILGRYGYWPKKWPLHPRPSEPQYSELIVRYRNGDLEPLERYMINNILGT